MKRDSRLSVILHVLLHMIAFDKLVTSEAMASGLGMNPVVFRRTMAGLREAGLVRSEKGHGGGWLLACDPKKTTLLDIYKALGAPELFAMTTRTESPDCLVEQSVNAALAEAYHDAGQVLLNRFEETTLASLAHDFKNRYKRQQCL